MTIFTVMADGNSTMSQVKYFEGEIYSKVETHDDDRKDWTIGWGYDYSIGEVSRFPIPPGGSLIITA